MSKEAWLREMERIQSELIDLGHDEDEAYCIACDQASDAVADRLADRIDMLRLLKKEGAL